ncbi:MAG: FixH family protein [Pseudomonadota bacterium]
MSIDAVGRKRKGMTGRHVLFAMLGFFGVIFAVNGVFLYFALKSYTGVVAVEPYRKGLAYNDRLVADARQKALGWSHTISLGSDGAVRVDLRDRESRPVTGLALTATIGRASTSAHDLTVSLIEQEGGVYRANTPPRAAGSWLVTLGGSRTNSSGERDVVYQAKERVWLKP